MQSTEKDQLFMGLAIELAHTAYDNDEVPVGAVIVQRRNSEVLSAFSNQMRATKSSINHAEMLAIQKAMEKVLGPNYNILLKKFIVSVPLQWVPNWIIEETKGVALTNLGPYIRPEYSDMTYFIGVDFHQDLIDYNNKTANFVTLYVYLDEVDENMSPLVLAPRSHIFGADTFPHKITVNDNSTIRICDF